MENAVDALKMVLGIFMFVLGLSVFFFMVDKVKATSDVVLFMSDKTNFYDMDELKSSTIGNRTVGIDTIITNIYRYNRENTGVTIIDRKNGCFIRYSTSDDNRRGQVFANETFGDYIQNYIVEQMNIAESDINMGNGYFKYIGENTRAAWNVDEDELIRHVNKEVFEDIEYIEGESDGGLLKKYKDEQFVESFVETTISEEVVGNIDTKKRSTVLEIIYTLQ